MPVYLCKPGCDSEEPWRLGLQVYDRPFLIEDTNDESKINESQENIIHPENQTAISSAVPSSTHGTSINPQYNDTVDKNDPSSTIASSSSSKSVKGHPLRRLRHSEVVLVDEVSIWYERYWLRLRWPGPQGGFAGYIPLYDVVVDKKYQKRKGLRSYDMSHDDAPICTPCPPQTPDFFDDNLSNQQQGDESSTCSSQQNVQQLNSDEATVIISNAQLSGTQNTTESSSIQESSNDDVDGNHQIQLKENDDSTNSNEPSLPLPPKCESTGLYFPSSKVMELLGDYDDGLSLNLAVGANKEEREPVFCRICREGLHDINYAASSSPSQPALPPTLQQNNLNPTAQDQNLQQVNYPPNDTANDNRNVNTQANTHNITTIAQLQKAARQHPAAENPLLSPCTCAGSMAFVHYLCVEQWRCRSRHPSAKEGLNCETCGSAYALPPPPVRPLEQTNTNADLDDLPPYIVAALRRPHLGWKIVTALVRRKLLRPIAPIVLSPLVALYCKARRMLKKRGVSRRRWACSLCRRRARWKCVRCLRSYYCSRQCQNISWHIVHKHVCYKRSRHSWSVIVYGSGIAFFIPGTWKNPIVYLSGIGLIPYNFFLIGVIAGFIATVTKKATKVDLRGRALELTVVLATLFMSYITWGLIQGFTMSSSHCAGILPGIFLGEDQNMSLTHYMSDAFLNIYKNNLILKNLKGILVRFDQIATLLPIESRFRSKVCSIPASTPFCFELTQNTNSHFLSEEPKCFNDSLIFAFVNIVSYFIMFFLWIFNNKRRGDRGRRAAANADVGGDAHHGAQERRLRRMHLPQPIAGGGGMQRPHQD